LPDTSQVCTSDLAITLEVDAAKHRAAWPPRFGAQNLNPASPLLTCAGPLAIRHHLRTLRPEPQGNMSRLHRISDHRRHLAGQTIEVDLFAHLG
jgi:hypothetical protein